MTIRFVIGGLYRTKDLVDILEDPPHECEISLIPKGNHLVFLAPADAGRIGDTWYWVEKNRKCKIITPTFFIPERFDLIELPA